MQRQIRSELHTIETDTNPRGRAPESVNHELIFRQILARRPSDSVYDVSSHERSGCTDAKFE